MTFETFTLPYAGTLIVERVLLSYDGPKLFIGLGTTEERFLCYWAGESEVGDHWLLMSISKQRLREIETGHISIRSAFLGPETGFVFDTWWNDQRSHPTECSVVPAGTIDSELLPSTESFIRTSVDEEHERLIALVPAFIRAKQQRRMVIRFRVLTVGNEAPVNRLAGALSNFQGTLEAFGQALCGKTSGRGMIQQWIVDQVSLSLSSVYAGSLGLELVSDDLQLVENTLLRNSIDTLDAVLEGGGDLTSLQGSFANLHKRSVTRYKSFLESIVDLESDVEIAWGLPTSVQDSTRILRQVDVSRSLASLYSEELSRTHTELIVGELVGINKRTRRFELRELGTDRKVSGRILHSALDSARSATLSHVYQAEVIRTDDYQPLTDEETHRFELLSLNMRVDPQAPGSLFKLFEDLGGTS